MEGILALIMIPVMWYCVKWLFGTPAKSNTTPEPPTEDVTILGCNGDCGYFIQEFVKNSNGNYDPRPGWCFCQYQNKTVRHHSPCPFAKDHPEQLRPSIFVD